MRPLRKFNSGWCSTDHHNHCRGAYNNPGNKDEPVWRCACKCHRGQEIEAPEPDAPRILNPRLAEQAEGDEWASKVIAYGHFEIPVDDAAAAKTVQARVNRASKRAGVRFTTLYKDGEVRCKVAKNQTRPTRKSPAPKRAPAKRKSTK
jgi:hypothetical protein